MRFRREFNEDLPKVLAVILTGDPPPSCRRTSIRTSRFTVGQAGGGAVSWPFRRSNPSTLNCGVPIRIQRPATRHGFDDPHPQKCATSLLPAHRHKSGGPRVVALFSFGHFLAPLSPVLGPASPSGVCLSWAHRDFPLGSIPAMGRPDGQWLRPRAFGYRLISVRAAAICSGLRPPVFIDRRMPDLSMKKWAGIP
jgi:hypothetical protein